MARIRHKLTQNRMEAYYHPGMDIAAPLRAERLLNFFSELEREHSKKILDIGCGGGFFLGMLKSAGFDQLYGCDVSTVSLNATQKRGIKNLVKINVENNLPFGDDVFDVVICTEVFEHLFDPHVLLSEIRRILKNDGMSIFSFPLELHISSRLRILFGKNIHNPLGVGGHIRFFRPRDIEELLHKNHFKISNKRYYCFGFKLDTYVPTIGRIVFLKVVKAEEI